MFLKVVRWVLGAIILFLDRVFTPRGIKRDSKIQAELDRQTAKFSLYQYAACPFCVKVRRTLKRQSLKVQTRDAKRCEISREELVSGGGKLKVPCLRIEGDNNEVHWMYESKDIIRFLENCIDSSELAPALNQ